LIVKLICPEISTIYKPLSNFKMRLISFRLFAISLTAVFAVSVPKSYAQSPADHYRFDFGNGKAQSGFTKVAAENTFSEEKGYGFELDSHPVVVSRKGKNALTADYITSDKPIYFSVNIPEGNYKVTVTLGDPEGSSITTVRAETRRLMLQEVKTKPGEIKKLSFIVNIRRPEISTGGKVSLKPRELGKLDWDKKLTLEFNDSKPCVAGVEIEKVNDQVTVYLAGNSTVVDQDNDPWASWGQMIPRFFKPGVVIANHAESGLALSSFLGSHRLDKVLSTFKAGDYLFIEFGHNDQKEKGPADGAYGSYTKRLKLFIEKIKERKGIPVIVTSTSRRSFDQNGKTVNTLGDYPEAARKVASEEHVALIDLNAMTTRLYDALGVEPSKKAFVHYPANTFPDQDKPMADDTHFNSYGAYELAKCIIEGIRANHLGIEKYIIDAPAFDPSKPDNRETFSLPLSIVNTAVKPDGN
jgi:lysophospholipase L1-like esterase